MPTEPFGRVLRLDAVIERTGLSRTTLYRRIGMSRFARQTKISDRCSGWRECVARDWLKTMFYLVEGDELWRGGGPSPGVPDCTALFALDVATS